MLDTDGAGSADGSGCDTFPLLSCWSGASPGLRPASGCAPVLGLETELGRREHQEGQASHLFFLVLHPAEGFQAALAWQRCHIWMAHPCPVSTSGCRALLGTGWGQEHLCRVQGRCQSRCPLAGPSHVAGRSREEQEGEPAAAAASLQSGLQEPVRAQTQLTRTLVTHSPSLQCSRPGWTCRGS